MKTLKNAVKSALHAVQQHRRQRELSEVSPHVTGDQLRDDLRSLGLAAGDIVWVHSSLKSLGYVEGGADTVIEALWQAIQPSGTLVIPAYYMLGTILGTCQDPEYVFDPNKMGSNLGAMPASILNRQNVQRSIHPTHSIAAIGPKALEIVGTHHLSPSAFGENSPWQRFTGLNGKLLGLGISLGPVTYYHHVEDMMGDAFPVNVWLPEVYQLRCRNFDGQQLLVPVRPFDPELMQVRIDHPSQTATRDAYWKEFERRGILHVGRVGESLSWWIRSQEAFDAIKDLAEHGVTIYALPPGAPQLRNPGVAR